MKNSLLKFNLYVLIFVVLVSIFIGFDFGNLGESILKIIYVKSKLAEVISFGGTDKFLYVPIIFYLFYLRKLNDFKIKNFLIWILNLIFMLFISHWISIFIILYISISILGRK